MQKLVLTVGTQGIELFWYAALFAAGQSAEWKSVLSTVCQSKEPLMPRPLLSHNQAFPEDEFEMRKQIRKQMGAKFKCCPVHSCVFVCDSHSV